MRCVRYTENTSFVNCFLLRVGSHSWMQCTILMWHLRPSVRLSVCPLIHSDIVSNRLNVPSKFFHPIYCRFLWPNLFMQFRWGIPKWASNTGWTWFSANKSLYLGNWARYRYIYYGRVYTKIVCPYRTTWFPMKLDDLESHLNCSKCLWIKYRGNIAFACYYVTISSVY